MWIGDRLLNENLPKSVVNHQAGNDGSYYWPNFILTSPYKTQHINLVEYCTNIANVNGTFVTCIQANQDYWCTESHIEENLNATRSEQIFKDLVL